MFKTKELYYEDFDDGLDFYDKFDQVKFKQKTKGKVYSSKHIRISQSKINFSKKF